MEHPLQIDLTPIVAALEQRLNQLERALAPLVEERRFVSIASAAAQLGLHPCTIRRALRRGELRSRRVGRRILVELAAPASR